MQAGSGKSTRDWDLAHSLLLLASGVVGPNTEKLLTYHHFHLYRPPLLCCARRWIREPAPRSPSQHLCAGTGTALPSSPVGKVWGNGYSSLKVSASLLHLSPFSCSLLLNVQNRFYLVYIKTLEIKQLFFSLKKRRKEQKEMKNKTQHYIHLLFPSLFSPPSHPSTLPPSLPPSICVRSCFQHIGFTSLTQTMPPSQLSHLL